MDYALNLKVFYIFLVQVCNMSVTEGKSFKRVLFVKVQILWIVKLIASFFDTFIWGNSSFKYFSIKHVKY